MTKLELTPTEKSLLTMSKEILKKSKKFVPSFFIELSDERLAYVDVSEALEDKEQLVASLKHLVEQTQTTKYFSVFDTKMLNGNTIQKEGKRILQSLKKEKDTTKNLKLIKQLLSITNRPTLNPLATDALILTTYDKVNGTDLVICPYVLKKGRIVFGRTNRPEPTQMNAIYNVWTPIQVNLK